MVAVGVVEGPAVVGGGDVPSAFMDAVVMEVAKRDEVVEFGWAAVFPMDDVVCVKSVFAFAPRELAHAVISAVK